MKDESEIPRFLLFFFRGKSIPDRPTNDPINHENGKEETESLLSPFSFLLSPGRVSAYPHTKQKPESRTNPHLRLLTFDF
jgi:hypothetical protein